mmetsp:Transcript_38668/g.95930  ORF Transcript_38668/g.95930 Transcript_38668/m.95930 type:complete len:284 (+) Transcript_38668:1425-2276(+)
MCRVSSRRSWCHLSAMASSRLTSYSSASALYLASLSWSTASPFSASDALDVPGAPRALSAPCISSTRCTYSSLYLPCTPSPPAKNRSLMMACAASLSRSFMAWYLPERLSSNTRLLRRSTLPPSSSGSPVNMAAYSLLSVPAADSTCARNASVAVLGACSGAMGSRGGSRSATDISAGAGGLKGGSSGLDSATAKVTVGGEAAAEAHAEEPSAGGSSSMGLDPSGLAGAAGRQELGAPPKGAASSAVPAAVTAPGLSRSSRHRAHTARYAANAGSWSAKPGFT